MSEYITHMAVADDMTRIIVHDSSIADAFRICMERHPDVLRLGSFSRGNTPNIVPMLTLSRQRWRGRSDGDLVEEKLAYTLGWVIHRGTDRYFKPIFADLDGDSPMRPSDVRVYHDLVTYREVFRGGEVSPFTPFALKRNLQGAPASQALDVSATEILLGSYWQQSLFALHEFGHLGADPLASLRYLDENLQDYYVDMERYVNGYKEPDPELWDRFIDKPNFYDANDSLIRFARSVQHGEPDLTIDIREAVDAAATQSQYAQALRNCYRYLDWCSGYFTDEMSRQDLETKLEIGKPPVPPSN